MIFTKDKEFYASFFRLLIVVALQNVVAYSVNMADNIMLGNFSQEALSGAATVNQIQFLLQQLTVGGFTTGLVALSSQYWGKRQLDPVRRLTAIALKIGLSVSVILIIATTLFPIQILSIFTKDPGILQAGGTYLSVIRFTYPFFVATTILLGALRSVEVVSIAFYVSLFSLVVNVGTNYVLIFGHFGMPRLGVLGAGIGTLLARTLEFLVVLGYLLLVDQRLLLFKNGVSGLLKTDKLLMHDYWKYTKTVAANAIIWAMATPIQTAILGHLTKDAIAANSVATTMYQYLKVIVIGEASATAVLVGTLLGKEKTTKELLRPYINSIQAIFLVIAGILGLILFMVRQPLLSLYALSPSALVLADQLLLMMVVVFIGMAYQMPLGSGVIQGGGDAKFSMRLNLISTWGIVIPLSFIAAFVLKIPVLWVVFIINSDQIFKCIPIGIRTNRYTWVRVLTREIASDNKNEK